MIGEGIMEDDVLDLNCRHQSGSRGGNLREDVHSVKAILGKAKARAPVGYENEVGLMRKRPQGAPR